MYVYIYKFNITWIAIRILFVYCSSVTYVAIYGYSIGLYMQVILNNYNYAITYTYVTGFAKPGIMTQELKSNL